VLLRAAPHIIRPLRFVMPHDPSMRPVWMIRAGLFLYDHLARRELLPASRTVRLADHPAGAPLKASYTMGFVYSDGWVDDARLVVLNAVDAAARGASILTRCRCVQAQRDGEAWRVQLQPAGGAPRTMHARALVNAAGPWAAQFLHRELGIAGTKALRLVKGSHIVVRKLFDHDHAYIFQNPDQRIIFLIPYEGEFTLVGTTEVDFDGEPGGARIDEAEIDYLCAQASRYLRQPVGRGDVVWTYSGVRPLLDDDADSGNPSAVTRDYSLELSSQRPPLLSVFGGKITTFRKLAEEAADQLCAVLNLHRARAWTEHARLPGGDFSAWFTPTGRPDTDIARFRQELARRAPRLDEATCARWARSYGALAERILEGGALGAPVAPGLHEAELRYLREQEWACDVDDVLWRRTKLGLHLSTAQRDAVRDWWAEQPVACA
jgi:glycerol-3-phosphate dehydrogenase